MTFLPKQIAALGAATLLALSTAACSDFLAVDNPGSIDADKLTDPANANLLVTGTIGEFQSMVASTALWGGMLSDELQNAHGNASYGPIDRRDLTNTNDIIGGVYSAPSRLRYAADTTADRLKAWLGADAQKDLRVARMLAFAGYGYIYLGEMFCGAPIQLSAPLPPDSLFGRALPRFEEAIAIAQAYQTTIGANMAAADSVLNLARVGAARAALNLGDPARAKAYAAAVPASFEYRAYYGETGSGLPTNPLFAPTGSPRAATTGDPAAAVDGGFRYGTGDVWTVVAQRFQQLNDPRVPHTTARLATMNGGPQFIPSQPKSFGGYVPPSAAQPAGQAMTSNASIRVASGLEAQYIVAEADGGVQSTLDFVNAQRAANRQPPSTAATGEEIVADLRDQRRREFYLDGHRVGDLRRYDEKYDIDLWETGPYLGSSTDSYGSVKCFPIPLSEMNSNPNVPRS